jgi:hypothetical protein
MDPLNHLKFFQVFEDLFTAILTEESNLIAIRVCTCLVSPVTSIAQKALSSRSFFEIEK